MNWVDGGIALVVAGSLIAGMRRGFIREGMRLFGLFAGLIVGIVEAPVGASFLHRTAGIPIPVGKVVAFIGLFLGVVVICRVVGEVIFHLGRLSPFGLIDRLGGGILGFCKGALVVSVILLILSLIPLPGWLDGGMKNSMLRGPFSGVALWAYDGIRVVLPLAKTFEQEMKEWKFNQEDDSSPSEGEGGDAVL